MGSPISGQASRFINMLLLTGEIGSLRRPDCRMAGSVLGVYMGGEMQGGLQATIAKAGDGWRVVVSSDEAGTATERLFEKQTDAVVYFLKISSAAQPDADRALNSVL
jgi:hypothetical protein